MASSPETAPSSEANSSSLNGSHPFPPPPIAATNSAPPPSSSPTQTSSTSTPSAPFKNSSSPPKHPAKASSVPAPLIDQKNGDSRKSSGAGFHIKLPVSEGDILGMIVFFVLFIGSVICVISCCLKKNKKTKKKKKKKDAAPHNSMSYYSDSGSSEKWQNRGPAGPNKMMGHPQAMAWHAPPPPPSLHSTELSMDYSGPHGPALPPPSPAIALGFIKSTFSYEQLASATNGFSPENLLGQGGFGYVYKGVLPNGKEIAVKQLKAGSGQGEREFQAEVEIISRVHHRHLVSLVGYCISGSQRLLVYDFVPNKTLEFHLHGNNRLTMQWPTRMKIALGSAKGLAYLHEDCHPRIIHRDIKTSNILLDNNFEAMVADFGLAKLSSDNYTHVSTRVMGTFGYLAPEYASSGKLTEKSDVFSFGVMLLELITGKRPVDSNPMEDSLVDWARPLLTLPMTEESYDELVDSRLEGNFSKVEMARMVACAAASIRHSAKRRPKMSQVVRALEGDSSLDDLNEGLKPGQSMLFTSSSDYDSGSYASNMRRIAFEGIDFNFSGQTSEYGLNPSVSSSSGEMMDASSRSRRVERKH